MDIHSTKKGTRWVRSAASSVAIGVLLLIVTRRLCVTVRIYGASMRPTMRGGDLLLGIRFPQRQGIVGYYVRKLLLKNGAIVLAHLRTNPVYVVKRVDGLAGEFRYWHDGGSGVRLSQIPNDHVFLISDAAQSSKPSEDASVDSRHYGPQRSSDISALLFLRYFPPSTTAALHVGG